jgi:diguanylate cyclase (GGDEF)-like protein
MTTSANTVDLPVRNLLTRNDERLERLIGLLRFAAAAAVLLFGQMLPNVGPVFVVVLGVFFAGYGLLVWLAWARVRTSIDREAAARLTIAADVGLVGFALFVFAPDPGWTIYASGFLVIASAGFRVRNGALLAAASLSLTYVVVMGFRATTLGIAPSVAQVVVHLAGYLSAGMALSVVLPELDLLREREVDLYEPILQAESDAGDALLLTEGETPVYWNHAYEALTGYTYADLARVRSTDELLVLDDPLPHESSDDHEPVRAHLRTQAGGTVEVEVVRRVVHGSNADREVWILRDVTTRDRANAELRDRAMHDTLTGLPNRALLTDRLAIAVAAAQRQGVPLSVLLLDLDGFKRVNDSWGHHVGDLVLIEVAARLKGALRESDTAARLGGDEFVLLLPDTPLIGALEAARALVELVIAPISIDGDVRSVGASVGIAVFPEHGRDGDGLLAAADAAMYKAKRAGGGYRAFRAAIEAEQP